MEIVEYDQIDPLQALELSLLALDFSLTPEHAARIRHTDPRPFPPLALYARVDGRVVGQVGVFRLPMVSVEGREDVGGLWAVSTHPEYARGGVASTLIEAAHARMRQAGLRFSTLGTSRSGVAFSLYSRFGYEDTGVWASALARWETAHLPTRLVAQPVGAEGYNALEALYSQVAGDYLGFAWRHMPFARLRMKINLDDAWVLWQHGQPVGYAFVRLENTLLKVTDLLLCIGVDAAEAVAAVILKVKAPYVQVRVSLPAHIASLRAAGYQVAQPTWEAFMVKPLVPEVTVADARRLFGIGGDRFLISWLDVT